MTQITANKLDAEGTQIILKIYIEDAAIYYESINRVERLAKPTMFRQVPAGSKAEPERRPQATS